MTINVVVNGKRLEAASLSVARDLARMEEKGIFLQAFRVAKCLKGENLFLATAVVGRAYNVSMLTAKAIAKAARTEA